MKDTLVLFDIDGTLISAGGISRRALAASLEQTYGIAAPIEGFEFAGKTDPQIVRELVALAGVDPGIVLELRPRALALYRDLLTSQIRPEDVREKPGATALLTELGRDPRVALGLLTGNLEECARAKLGPVGMNESFPFGAYGSDHEDRHRLPEVALRRAEEAVSVQFQGKAVVIVGDSVHDLRCGRHLGVRAVGVATGPTPMATLEAEKPDALVESFQDLPRALDAILGSAHLFR